MGNILCFIGEITVDFQAELVKKLSDAEQEIELVPYGCTQLRLTVFPQLASKIKVEGLD